VKSVCKSFHDLCDIHDKNHCDKFIFNLFFICSTIYFLIASCFMLRKLIKLCCFDHKFYRHNNKFDKYCGCGCQEESSESNFNENN